MNPSTILPILKASLLISGTALDNYLTQLIQAAMAAISGDGIRLEDTAADIQFVALYANWLYHTGRLKASEMYPALREMVNDRKIKAAVPPED